MKRLFAILAATIGFAVIANADNYVNLSTLTGNKTLVDGDIVSGTLSGNHKISIANGATIKLNNVTINGVNNENYNWAGITCLGDATIFLFGDNTVRGFWEDYPGIYVPEGSTLTILGGGSLDASSNGYGAGIGGGFDIPCGNIKIIWGDITATGGSHAAGIGGGGDQACGNILIYGKTVTATGGTYAPGIGSGGSSSWSQASCGNIIIYGGIVTATGGINAAGIGSGKGSKCSLVDVTSEIYAPCVTATCGKNCDKPIGAGVDGTCDFVFVSSDLDSVTSGQTRKIKHIVNLADITQDTQVIHGETISGTLGGNYKISIADGSTVTLKNATIRGANNPSYAFAGITCEGDATIILEGANVVKGFYDRLPGIFVPSGRTLTIKGTGSLNASSNGSGAGIGGGYGINCGNIIIEGGTVSAQGGSCSAGIGSGDGGGSSPALCGYITINGGDITATGGVNGAGIGCGRCGECGNITIGSGISSVTATRDSTYTQNLAPIGKGSGSSTTGTITIAEDLNDVTSDDGDTRTIKAWSLRRLELLVGNPTYNNFEIITGTLIGSFKVYIADGATVKLRNATIIGENNANYDWAGITCLGNATIILEGDNTVKGFDECYPGISVPAGKTLTIKGNGSLTASSNGWGAGIGGGYNRACGNIVIESGTINATGGGCAAGIGSGYVNKCGSITISGGTVTATGGLQAAGIGSGSEAQCGTITIGAGITRITATCGESCSNPIGAGYNGSCGILTLASGLIDSTTGSTRVIARNGGIGTWAAAKGLRGADAEWDAKPAMWGGKWANAFIYTYGEGLANGTTALMSIKFDAYGRPIVTTAPVIEGRTDFSASIIGVPSLDNWDNPVILNRRGNDWTLPSGKAANFFRVKLSK